MHAWVCRWDYGQVQYYQNNNLRIVQNEFVALALGIVCVCVCVFALA